MLLVFISWQLIVAMLVDAEVGIGLSLVLATGFNPGVARNEYTSVLVKGEVA